MREALTVDQDGLLLHGTAHIGPRERDVGVLFVNSGTLPRSSRGDLYAHLADALAELGFRGFRFDLPGLGDSQGEISREFVEFYEDVQEGAYAKCVASLARELRRRHGLKAMVLAGICGGAQTSVFAAAADSGEGITGLVLLDMPFFLYRSLKPAAPEKAGQALTGRVRSEITDVKGKLRAWVLAQRWEPFATKVYYGLKKIVVRSKSKILPPNTNQALVKALSGLLDLGVPALLITAHPPIPEPVSFDYIGYLADTAGGRIEHAKILGTTHSFVESGGAEAVQAALSAWLEGLGSTQ